MALRLASRPCPEPLSPAKQLNEAINDFQRILTDDQRTALKQIKAIPDADAVLVFTAQLDASQQDRRGRSIATRLHSVLQSVREFSAVIETFVSSNPEIAALIWGSVKLTIQVALNFTSYYEVFSNLFMGIAVHCPRFAEYSVLYPTSLRLQTALCNFHASLIRCCKHAVQVAQRPWKTHLLHALWQSFEQEFKPDISSIQRCGDDVREEISLAKAQADLQDQELQRQERKLASGHRRKLREILSRTGHDLDTIKEWQLQQDKRRAGERRRQLLDSLSSYDHLPPFKRACKERHCNTAQWVFDTAEFRRWMDGASPWIWCSGKIGSGKTILVASAVSHVFAHKSRTGETVTFFFPQFNDPLSLCAETVIRSIIRQLLDPMTLSEEMEASLEEMSEKPSAGIGELTFLLRQRVAQLEKVYIFIDALDEFESRERRALLDSLASLGSCGSDIRVFLAGRESLSGELKDKFPGLERLSMASAEARTDLVLYVKEALQDKVASRDLVVGDQSLISVIEQALSRHADGMFLWVSFLIDELCAQHCDDDIRMALGRLPRTLAETFSRALLRIVSRQNVSVAVKTFSWVAVAKRPLTLGELREAISTEIGQAYSMPQRLVNGIDQLASWCENLIHVDEELNTVQFAHQAVYQFIIEGPTGLQFKDFCFSLPDADHHAGEICVTYLNLNDFKTTLARRPQPLKAVDPVAMASLALSNDRKVPKTIPAFGMSFRRHKSKAEVDVIGSLSNYEKGDAKEGMRKLEQSHPFLMYASTHWASHTSRFRKKSATWNLWHQMVTCGHDLAKRPWPEQQPFNALDPDLLAWSLQSLHYGLLRVIEDCGGISEPEKRQEMWTLAEQGDVGLLEVLLEGDSSPRPLTTALQAASENGQAEIVERLLAAGADVNARHEGRNQTALEVASKGGHLAVVDRLLSAGAFVNADPSGSRGSIALLLASENGHLEVVERLLTAGADVNARSEGRNRAALESASAKGHLAVVERLLSAGAHVNPGPSITGGRTALQAAAWGGHLAVVERLLVAGADVNASPARHSIRGRTALHAASERGHLAVVERLLTAGADVNADDPHHGQTALEAASGCLHREVVERLLAAGAKHPHRRYPHRRGDRRIAT